jgi:hypothetical protein
MLERDGFVYGDRLMGELLVELLDGYVERELEVLRLEAAIVLNGLWLEPLLAAIAELQRSARADAAAGNPMRAIRKLNAARALGEIVAVERVR